MLERTLRVSYPLARGRLILRNGAVARGSRMGTPVLGDMAYGSCQKPAGLILSMVEAGSADGHA
jgi:hypothetical protein